MPYNRKNFLLKVKQVNEIYMHYHSQGVTNVYIYNNYIRDRFCISLGAMYRYLTIPYKKQLAALEVDDPPTNDSAQLSIFD